MIHRGLIEGKYERQRIPNHAEEALLPIFFLRPKALARSLLFQFECRRSAGRDRYFRISLWTEGIHL